MNYTQSVSEFGIEHTHDESCRSWQQGQNWFGSCDCTLPVRSIGA